MTTDADQTTELGDKMRARADLDGLPADHEMRLLAGEFDKAAYGYAGEPQTYSVKQFMGHWARARKCWCNYTGEPLI
jgi:hypothetical protein